MSNAVGDFVVKLFMKTDEGSFQKGMNSIKNFESTTKKLLGVVTTTSAAFVGMAVGAGSFATAELKAAKAIGISADNLNQWKTVASAAGTNAGALASSMGAVEAKMQRLKMGQIDMGLAKNLGMLGIGYGNFASMNANQRMAAVFGQAQGMTDQAKAARLVGDTLGEAALDYYNYLQLSGKNLNDELRTADRLNFTTGESRNGAMEFHHSIMQVYSGVKSITAYLGQNLASRLTPVANKIRDIIAANHDLIQSGILGFVEYVGQGASAVFNVITSLGPSIQKIVNSLGGLDKIIMRIGIGFSVYKVLSFANGIRQVVQGIGLLKVGIMGLGLGALMLLLEDFMVYMAGGDSVIGKLMDLKIGDSTLGKDIREIGESIKGLASQIGPEVKDAIKYIVDLTKSLVDLIKAIAGNDMDTAKEKFKELMGTMFNTKEVKETFDMAYQEQKDSGKSSVEAWDTAVGEASQKIPIIGPVLEASGDLTNYVVDKAKEGTKKLFGKKKKVNDGIIRPNGQITQVAPDDWVFATKNVADMASAFMPRGAGAFGGGNSAVYNINQNFNINGARDIGQSVRAQAYNGTKSALVESMARSNTRLQLMAGGR